MRRREGQWRLDDRVSVPFTTDEADSLNAYQASGIGHPFTCGNDECRGPDKLAGRGVLRADPVGWTCPHCDYMQEWAWKWMSNWAFLLKNGPWPLHVLTGTRDEPQPGVRETGA